MPRDSDGGKSGMGWFDWDTAFSFGDYGPGQGPGRAAGFGQNTKSGSRQPVDDKYIPWDVVSRPPQLRKFSFGSDALEDKRSGLPRGRRTNRLTTVQSKARPGAKYGKRK